MHELPINVDCYIINIVSSITLFKHEFIDNIYYHQRNRLRILIAIHVEMINATVTMSKLDIP
ncbi:hypothetical protein PPBDW_I21227 [Photobacterium kishitanii]|nr:hypothetical protein PPBDW_I21227 [Photobacterium kishitanii]